MTTTPFPDGGLAVVVGASGAIGSALEAHLRDDPRFADVVGLSRSSTPALDLLDEASIAAAAAAVAEHDLDVRLVIDATGFLHGDGVMPEKSLRALDPAQLAHAFAINAIGPALLMKHLLPLLPRTGKSAFATISARVASLGENRLGGWYGYRASKTALNQLLRTAAAEIGRGRREAVLVALHPGHVESRLSAPFGSGGQPTLSPDEAAAKLLTVIDGLTPADSGGFFDQEGQPIPW
jgi:NAD(P)-dependent dehydrogenase (short-subunit alcohol dehydrogenase family)